MNRNFSCGGTAHPLCQREPSGLIRTILGVNETDGSLTLAGAISQDGYLRLMHAHADGLVDGAEEAARATLKLMAAPSLPERRRYKIP